MNKESYPIIAYNADTYTFVSIGRSGKVLKAVVFQIIEKDLVNLALLDYDEFSKSWSDTSNTNNNDDISITMKTVLFIILEYLKLNKEINIVIKANNRAKLLLYNRIFRNYYADYADEIIVLTDSPKGKIEASLDKIHDIFYICKK